MDLSAIPRKASGEASPDAVSGLSSGHLEHDRKPFLDRGHPNTLTTRHNLAYFRGGAGDAAGAAADLQQLLHDRQRILGPDHPDTLATRRSLAYWEERS